MKKGPARTPVTLGFRVKTGWAAWVLLRGPASRPSVLECRRVLLADPALPDTRQPYHAGFGTARTDRAAVHRLIRAVERYARRSLAPVFREARSRNRALRGVGLVIGSDIDPASITNPHIRAHAAEGRLYRRLLEAAAGRRGFAPVVVLERQLYPTVAQRLRLSEGDLRRRVLALQPETSGTWRAEEKAAALVAWLALLSRPTPRVRARRQPAVA